MLNILDRAVEAIVAAVIVASTAMLMANVFAREVLATGIVWADELPGLLLVWIAFLGAYLTYRRDAHIAFDLFVSKLPFTPRLWVETLGDALVLGFAVAMVNLSWRMIARVGGREIETMEIAQGWFMAVLPVSFALIALALAIRIWRRHRFGVSTTGPAADGAPHERDR